MIQAAIAAGQREEIGLKKRALLSVNAAVLLFGLAGLFARWIHLPAIEITFGRVLFSSVALGAFMRFSGRSFCLQSRRDAGLLIAAGAVLALHWWAFLQAIQLSSVAVGTLTFSSFPLFVTFLEPLVSGRPPSRRNVILSVIILIGVLITVPEFSIRSGTAAGIATGMVSSLAYAVLTLMNKGLSERYGGVTTAFYEQATAAVLLLPFAAAAGIRPTLQDVGLLLVLGVVATAFAHTLFISGLKAVPAQLAGICSSMETVYGILFALLLLGERPASREVAGAAVIVGAVVAAQAFSSLSRT